MLLPLDSLVIVPVGQFLSAAVVHLVDALDTRVSPEDAPQTDGNTTWCRRHSLVSIGPECVYCLQGKPSLETWRGGI